MYSIRMDTNLALFCVWIFCITKLGGFWKLHISIFIKSKGVCFHYLKQFILIGVQQAWNFVSSTNKPKYKMSLTVNGVKCIFFFEFNSFQPWGTSRFAHAFVRYRTHDISESLSIESQAVLTPLLIHKFILVLLRWLCIADRGRVPGSC
jgi:hypothetical protein